MSRLAFLPATAAPLISFLLMGAVIALAPRAAQAHPESVSSLRLVLGPSATHVTVILPVRDLSRWFPPGRFKNYTSNVAAELAAQAPDLVLLAWDEQVQRPTKTSVHPGMTGYMRHISFIASVVMGMVGLIAGAAEPELVTKPVLPPVPLPQELSGSAVGLRIIMGLTDTEPTDWSGAATLSAGKVAAIRGWRWTAGDGARDNSWTLHTKRQPLQNPNSKVNKGKRGPISDAGIVLMLSEVADDTKIEIKTAAGPISFSLSDVPYGKRLTELKGAVEIERVPGIAAVARTNADEDYPAAVAAPDGTIYLTYLSFTRGKDFQAHRERLTAFGTTPVSRMLSPGPLRKIEKPEDLDYLREPAGGETLYLRVIKDGKFSPPIVITETRTELYRAAIAVEGSGKVWVIYSTHLNAGADLDGGDWELMARRFDPKTGKVEDAINLSNAAGTDFMPAATTDSAGRVWVTWVGERGEHFSVFSSHQAAAGATFTPGQRITSSPANEWEPSIAADRDGDVAIAWDTYEKGDYDVYLSRAKGDGPFSAPQAVAATLNYEVRPSLAFDAAGRLWVAWEQSGELWGKDFGALKKKGIPLYGGGRTLGIKVLDPSGKWFTPPDVASAGGGPGLNPYVFNTGSKPRIVPKLSAGPARARGGVAPCYPRLAVDTQGHVWLAFRARQWGDWHVEVGSVWFEFVTRLEGDSWLPATWVPHSNNILDNRPALVADAEHGLLMFFSGDGRGEVLPAHIADPHTEASAPAGSTTVPTDGSTSDEPPRIIGSGGGSGGPRPGGPRAGPDPNNDIYAALFHPGASPAAPVLTPAPAVDPAKPGVDVEEERAAVKTLRDYRVNLNGETLRIWRGEFHRHTELSPDGGGDGGLLDMWRYTIDAASLDWVGDGDHDYGNGREYSWWTTQKAVTLFTIPRHFTPVFSYERSVSYPEGHRNCMFARRGLRSLPRLPLSPVNSDQPAPDTNLFYMYLHHFDGICASHTSATSMGTDWRNNDPAVEPLVEIYQGDRNNYERPDAPRSAVREAQLKQSTPEEESFGGYRPKGFVNLALLKGYRLAFESSSDHISTHLSYCNVYVTEPTRAGIIDAIKKRRVYGSTDNIIADVRCKAGGTEHFMGEEFSTDLPPTIDLHFIGARVIEKVTIIKDDIVVFESAPNQKEVKFQWTDPRPMAGRTSYYYVRGEQVPDVEGATGEIVWASPLWIKYTGK